MITRLPLMRLAFNLYRYEAPRRTQFIHSIREVSSPIVVQYTFRECGFQFLSVFGRTQRHKRWSLLTAQRGGLSMQDAGCAMCKSNGHDRSLLKVIYAEPNGMGDVSFDW